MSHLPATFKALRVQEVRNDLELVVIPLASRPEVQNIDANYILIKVRVVGLNPIDWKV